jgi:hypothetical protein
MRAMLVLAMASLVVTAGCGGDGSSVEEEARRRAGADTPDAAIQLPAPADTAATLGGKVFRHPEANFNIYWPTGCERVQQRMAEEPTERAEREVITFCDRPEASYRVIYYGGARDSRGDPAHPRLVVAIIEQQLAEEEMQTIRQRPLQGDGMQGVDVHARRGDGSRFLWIRGLLVGTDVYILTVAGPEEGIFMSGETREFFESFTLGGGS